MGEEVVGCHFVLFVCLFLFSFPDFLSMQVVSDPVVSLNHGKNDIPTDDSVYS